MAITRIHHDENYTCVSNAIARDKNLSFKAKGLLFYMLSCKDDWNFNIQGVCTMGTDGYESVRTGLIELEKAGYLQRTYIRENEKILDIQYDIYESNQGVDFYEQRVRAEER